MAYWYRLYVGRVYGSKVILSQVLQRVVVVLVVLPVVTQNTGGTIYVRFQIATSMIDPAWFFKNRSPGEVQRDLAIFDIRRIMSESKSWCLSQAHLHRFMEPVSSRSAFLYHQVPATPVSLQCVSSNQRPSTPVQTPLCLTGWYHQPLEQIHELYILLPIPVHPLTGPDHITCTEVARDLVRLNIPYICNTGPLSCGVVKRKKKLQTLQPNSVEQLIRLEK